MSTSSNNIKILSKVSQEQILNNDNAVTQEIVYAKIFL